MHINPKNRKGQLCHVWNTWKSISIGKNPAISRRNRATNELDEKATLGKFGVNRTIRNRRCSTEPNILRREDRNFRMASRSTRSKRVPTQPEEPQSRAKWTASLTKTLADLMVDQVREGNRPKKSFATKAWNSICDNFRKETGLMWDKEQLKSRFAALKKQYNIVKSLLEHRDFSYDESSCTIIATDEAWYNYVQDHPDADIIRIGGCPIYKQLCIIFLELGANGKGSHVEEIPETPYPEPMNVLPVESASGSEEVANMEYKEEDHVPHATNKNGRKRGRKGIDDSIAEAILKMAAASKLRTAAVEQYRARFSMTNCIKALDEVQGIDEPVYFAALDLFNNPSAREIFLSLKHDKRLTWLQGKCAGPSGS